MEQEKDIHQSRDYCRHFCKNSLGWNDNKRAKCRLNTPCAAYSEWVIGGERDLRETELMEVCTELLARCEVLDEADCPTRLLARARTAMGETRKARE